MALPVHVPVSASFTFKKLRMRKWETLLESDRESERKRRRRGRLSHHPFVQSWVSACCFGNVMSVQPLANPLRLASFVVEVCMHPLLSLLWSCHNKYKLVCLCVVSICVHFPKGACVSYFVYNHAFEYEYYDCTWFVLCITCLCKCMCVCMCALCPCSDIKDFCSKSSF